jgi:hypothetical protein
MAKQVKFTRNRSGLFHLGVFGVVFLVLFSGRIYNSFNNHTTITRIVPTLDAVLEIKFEITQSRLLLEEVFRGDETVLLQSAWQHLELADGYAQALLQDKSNQPVLFEPIQDEQFRIDVEVLHARLIL